MARRNFDNPPVPGYVPIGVQTQLAPEGRTGHNLMARSLASIGDRLQAFANSDLARQAERARDQGLAAGRIAGSEDPAARMEGDTIRAQAFNRGALEAGARRLEIGARDRVADLARTYGDDPAAFEREAAAYREGIAGSLPMDGRARFTMAFDGLARPYLNQARRNADLRVARERTETFDQAWTARSEAVRRLAGNASLDRDAAAGLSGELVAARTEILAMGPRETFELNGVRYEADPSRAGALTPRQITQRLADLEDMATDEAVLGDFRRGPGSRQWVDDFRRTGEASGLAPERVERLQRRMLAEIDARERSRNRDRETGEAAARPATIDEQAQTARGGFDLMRQGALEPGWVDQNRARLMPADYRVLRRAADSGPLASADAPDMLAELQADVESEDPFAFAARAARAVESGRLTPASYAALVDRNRAASVQPETPARRGRARVRDTMAPRAGASGVIERVAGEVRGEALGEFDDWRQANPNATTAETAQATEAISQRARGRAWERASAALPLPRGYTGARESIQPADVDRVEQETIAALDARTLPRAEAVRRLRELRQWRQAMAWRPGGAPRAQRAEAAQ